MNGLLEILITFVGAVLVLALVAQSMIEVVKASFPIEGFTRAGSARSLLAEAATVERYTAADGEAIYRAIRKRLKGLGQDGWVGVRLDTLTAHQLESLVRSVRPPEVPGMAECHDFEAALERIGARARLWFPLAMEPVSERYRRRMTSTNLIVAGVIVLTLNVDALSLFQRARTDDAFRTAVASNVAGLDSLITRTDSLRAELATALTFPDTAGAGANLDTATVAALRAGLDTLTTRSREIAYGGLFEWNEPRRWGELSWWLGIVLTALLVSLGAPFWHDLLGTLFGLKRRIRFGPAEGDGNGQTRGGLVQDPAPPGPKVPEVR